MQHRNERGQVAPLLALFAVAIGLACLGLGRFGADAVALARARTAADAAALAGAVGGAGEARALAAANGGAVTSFEAAGGDVRVRVVVDGAGASARARASAGAGGGSAVAVAGGGSAGDGTVGGLAPAVRAALARAAQVLGEPVRVTSGYRSAADQRRLWTGRAGNPYPVAPPGSSQHERGLAVDVAAGQADRLAAASRSTGLCRPYPQADPVHFEPC